MQGYYNYVIYGTKEELEEAEKIISNLAETDSSFRYLERDKSDIETCSRSCSLIPYEYVEENYGLAYGMSREGSGNIKGVPFSFEEMMSVLSKLFKDLYIEGQYYLLDFMDDSTYWKSKRNSDTYKEFFGNEFPKEYEIELEDSSILSEGKDLVVDTMSIECPCCNTDTNISLDTTTFFLYDDENDGYIYFNVEGTCSECNETYILDVTVPI